MKKILLGFMLLLVSFSFSQQLNVDVYSYNDELIEATVSGHLLTWRIQGQKTTSCTDDVVVVKEFDDNLELIKTQYYYVTQITKTAKTITYIVIDAENMPFNIIVWNDLPGSIPMVAYELEDTYILFTGTNISY